MIITYTRKRKEFADLFTTEELFVEYMKKNHFSLNFENQKLYLK